MPARHGRQRSLSARTVRSTVQSCIVFSLAVQILSLSFFVFHLTRQYISFADTTVKQVRMAADSFVGGADQFDDQTMLAITLK